MRRAYLMCGLVFAIAGAIQPVWAQQCEDADPWRVTAQVYGDFEFTPDTDDPDHHLIFVSNVENGRSSIVVARLDGSTGKFDRGTLTTIANNFQGDVAFNGPEFVHPPGFGIGVLYRALDGVHGVFRLAEKTRWNQFVLDVNGGLATANPPVLVSSYKSSYETGGLLLGQNTYVLFEGPCTLRCFANIHSGIPTDPASVLQQTSKLTIPTIASLSQSPSDGTFYFEACTLPGAANVSCGLFEAAIDGAGGFLPGSFRLLVTVPLLNGPMSGPLPLASEKHPVTGTNVIFVKATHQDGDTIDVYEQLTIGSPPSLIASMPFEHSSHYRVVDSPTEIILHFLVQTGSQSGSYALPVTASTDGRLRVGAIKKISSVADAEVEYLSGARKFTIFYRTSRNPSLITRCFFDP